MGVYSSYSLHESSINSSNDGNALDLVVENARDDMRMFDSVIELDFMNAYNEAGLISINEEEAEAKAKVGIGQHIKDIFHKLIETIKSLFNKLCDKISSLFHNDAALYKKYGAGFSKAAGTKVKNFRPMKDMNVAKEGYRKKLADLSANVKATSNELAQASSAEAINKVSEKAKKFSDDIKDDSKEFDKIFFDGDVKEEYELSSSDISTINGIMGNGGRNIIKMLKGMSSDAQSSIKKAQQNANADKYAGSSGQDEFGTAKANALFKACNQYSSALTKTTNAMVKVANKWIANARKAFISAGRASVSESANAYGISDDVYDAILGEASDMYVEAALAMD